MQNNDWYRNKPANRDEGGAGVASDTKVYLLDLGSMALDGLMIYWMHGPSGPIRFPVYGVLIDHADGKFLYDTGFDKSFIDSLIPNNAIQSERQTLQGQLDMIGLTTSDITHVINSHYHVDHVGGNKHCRHATTVCHKCELEAAARPRVFEERGYSDMSFAPGLRGGAQSIGYGDDIYTPKFETLTGDQEIAKGVFLFETPGHTPGHYSLMVQLAERRPMLFSGDACYTRRALNENIIPGAHVDVEASFNSLSRLRQLAEQHEADVFCSHDPDSWKTWQPAPGFYS
jgi:4-pyridoxolactonase